MRKYILTTGFSLLCLLLLTACKKNQNKILPKKEGIWNVVEARVQYYENDTLITDEISTPGGSFTFEKDGEGSMVDPNISGDTQIPMAWYYDDEKEEILILNSTSSHTHVYSVLEFGRKEQTWFVSYSSSPNFLPLLRWDHTLKLIRQE